jgi:hypothetical protein
MKFRVQGLRESVGSRAARASQTSRARARWPGSKTPSYSLAQAVEIASRLAKLLVSKDRVARQAEALAREIFQIDAPEKDQEEHVMQECVRKLCR